MCMKEDPAAVHWGSSALLSLSLSFSLVLGLFCAAFKSCLGKRKTFPLLKISARVSFQVVGALSFNKVNSAGANLMETRVEK